jgi:hypothetical protein
VMVQPLNVKLRTHIDKALQGIFVDIFSRRTLQTLFRCAFTAVF